MAGADMEREQQDRATRLCADPSPVLVEASLEAEPWVIYKHGRASHDEEG